MRDLIKSRIIGVVCIVGVIFVANSCNSSVKSNEDKSPVVVSVQAQGRILPSESLAMPVPVKASPPRIINIGVLDEYQGSTNRVFAKKPDELKISNPVVQGVGVAGNLLPVQVKVNEVAKNSGMPKKVLVKDAYTRSVNPFNFCSFSKLQGLKHDQIRDMLQDSLGNLWLGTDDGLTQFDGKYFYHYTTDNGLGGNLIITVFQDSKGNLWIGTFRGGLTRYDGKHMTTFTTSNGLLSNVVNAVVEDKQGRIWIGTGGGLSVYDNGQLLNYTEQQGLGNNDISSMVIDDNERVWMGTNGGGITSFDGKTFVNYSTNEGFVDDFVASVNKDRKGNIWFGTLNCGVVKYDGKIFENYSKVHGLSSNSIDFSMEDSHGRMWFATTDSGIAMFDGNSFYKYHSDEGLNSDCVRCLLEDSEGTLWIGTRSTGLSKYLGDVFTHLTDVDGLPNKAVSRIVEEKPGIIWLGTSGGHIVRCEEKIENGIPRRYFKSWYDKNPLRNGWVYAMLKDSKGRMWFGYSGAITVFDGKRMEIYAAPHWLPNDPIRDIIEDREGNLWIATYGKGVSKFDGKTFTNYTTSEGLSSNNVMSLLQDSKGNIWFATDGGGLTKFDGQTFTRFSQKENFFSDMVYCMTEDKFGNIWIGSGGAGLLKYDGVKFTRYSENEGLGNHVFSLKIDHDENMWIGTRFGFFRLDKSFVQGNIDELNPSQITAYGYEEGFLGIGCTVNAIAEIDNKEIWVGTNDRLTIYHGEMQKKKLVAPNIQITDLLVFNEKIPWVQLDDNRDTEVVLKNGLKLKNLKFKGTSNLYGLPQGLNLPYYLNYLTFNYIGITHDRMRRVNYEYMLEGLDKAWNNPTDVNEVSFGNLKPGKYTFKVRAVLSGIVKSEEMSFSFRIMPPWWKTWWFYVLVSLMIILSAYFYMISREKKLMKDREMLQKKVQEQTYELTLKNKELENTNFAKDKLFSIIAHDLKGPFSSFLGLTQVMSEDLYSFTMEEINSFAQSMNLSARNIYALLENLLHWARMQQGTMIFTPKHINLSEIASDNMEWTIQAANDKQINLVIDIPDDIELQADDKMLQTVIRNIVNNAIKFTPRGGEILLRALKRSDGFVEILVQDNGIGMGKDVVANLFNLNLKTGRSGTEGEPSTGLGLIICKELVEKHRGSIKVVSVEGEGSKFIITLPISM